MKQFDERGSNLIFLVALPGSGAPLLQRLLNRQPSVHSLPDSWIMLHPLYALKHDGLETDYEAPRARSALDSFLATLPGGEHDYIAGVRAMASVLYGRALSISGKSIFLDCTQRYYHILPELRRVFPKARFVFLLRNPMAALSASLNSVSAESLAEFKNTYEYADLINAPGKILAALQASDSEPVVRYEQLATAPQNTLQALCLQLNIQYDSVSMAVIPEESTAVGAVGDSVAGASIQWAAVLTSPEQRSLAKDYLTALGESLITGLGYNYAELHETLHGEVISAAKIPTVRDADTLNEEGELLFSCGDIDAAMERFQEALRLNDSNPLTLNNIAVAHWQRGNLPEALTHLARGMEIAPDNHELVANGAHILCAAERPADAISLCRSYLQEYPQDDGVRQIVESIEVQYKESTRSSVVNNAITNDVIASDKNAAQGLNHDGEKFFADGNLAAAKQAFEQALVADPHNVEVLNNLGVLFWHEGATELAHKYLCGALEVQPDYREALGNYVAICNALGNSQEPRILCENYLNLHPGDEQIGAMLINIGADTSLANVTIEDMNIEGERLFENGDIDGAIEVFLHAYRLDPSNGTTCNNLGVISWRNANPEDALMYLGRAMEAEPDNPEFVNNGVQLLIDTGRVQDALALCTAYINKHPEHLGSIAATGTFRNAASG